MNFLIRLLGILAVSLSFGALAADPPYISLAGKNLVDIAVLRGLTPTIENAAEATLWLVENGSCGGVPHPRSNGSLSEVLCLRHTMLSERSMYAEASTENAESQRGRASGGVAQDSA